MVRKSDRKERSFQHLERPSLTAQYPFVDEIGDDNIQDGVADQVKQNEGQNELPPQLLYLSPGFWEFSELPKSQSQFPSLTASVAAPAFVT